MALFCQLSLFSLSTNAADARFGVMSHFAQGWDPGWSRLIAGTSLEHVRDELYWNAVESTRGVYNFSVFDPYMAQLQRDQITPLIIMSFENSLYDGGNTPYTAAARDAYANYGAAILNHYGAQIKALEIWNEYNGGFCIGPATGDREGNYTRMLAVAHQKIKALRPDVTVLGGSTIGVPLPYWENLMQAGALQYMDVLAIHPYRYSLPPEGIENDILALQQLTARYNSGQAKPIWVTEIGWQENANPAPGGLALNQATAAKYLVRAYTLLLSAHVQRIYWYLFRDHLSFNMGLYQSDQTPKMAADAMATMIHELTGFDFLKKEATPDHVYSLVFQNFSGQQIRVLWALSPTTVTLSGVTKIVDLTGHALATNGVHLLSDAPIFVEGAVTGIPLRSAMDDLPLADSRLDFGPTQGSNGWSYGNILGNSGVFVPMVSYTTTAWTGQWSGVFPYAVITPSDQHPSYNGAVGVATVRRWTSTYSGQVHLTGLFQCGPNGDGVGISITLDGQPALARKLIGNGGSEQQNFDLVATVHIGSIIDFSVDPGPRADVGYDATILQAKIAASSIFIPDLPITPIPPSTPSPPTPTGSTVAEAAADFSGTQGTNGWMYGSFPRLGSTTFEAANTFSNQTWLGRYPQLSLSSASQHPGIGLNGLDQVVAVRRWVSSFTGTVNVVGQFTNTRSGDGAGVQVLVNGSPFVSRTIIGVTGNSLVQTFDFSVPVSTGTTIDFAVDPGPGRDVNFDEIGLSAKITSTTVSPPVVPTPPIPPATPTPPPPTPPTPPTPPAPGGGSPPTPPATPTPSPSGTLLADSASDFTSVQNSNGWSYGDFANEGSTAFEPATTFNSGSWSGRYFALGLSATTQHSAIGLNGLDQVCAVRRWTSTYDGAIRLSGQFAHDRSGDGVGVRILLNGQPILPRTLVGVTGASSSLMFDLITTVSRGDTIDFGVDPGPGRDLNGDNPTVTAKITVK